MARFWAIRVPLIPNFSLASSSRVIYGEFDRQVKLRGLIPQALHPRPLLYGHSQIQYGLAPLCGGVAGC